MSLFRKKDKIKSVHTKRVGISMRLRAQKKKTYVAKILIMYEDKPLRQFETSVKAYSKYKATQEIQKHLDLKLVSVAKQKK